MDSIRLFVEMHAPGEGGGAYLSVSEHHLGPQYTERLFTGRPSLDRITEGDPETAFSRALSLRPDNGFWWQVTDEDFVLPGAPPDGIAMRGGRATAPWRGAWTLVPRVIAEEIVRRGVSVWQPALGRTMANRYVSNPFITKSSWMTITELGQAMQGETHPYVVALLGGVRALADTHTVRVVYWLEHDTETTGLVPIQMPFLWPADSTLVPPIQAKAT